MTTPRYDIYRLIHKGLRLFMTDTLTAAGTLDAGDPAAVAEVTGRVRALLAFCRAHVRHENGFVHTAMEARAPGSAAAVAGDHDHHLADIAALEELADAVAAGRADAHTLYRRLAVFVGENLVHMEQEEGRNNAVLWQAFQDEEIMAIERAIVDSQPPADKMLTIRWIAAAATPAERTAFLAAVRAAVPPAAFAAILEMVGPHLRPAERDALALAA